MDKKTGLGKGLSALFNEKKVDLNALDEKSPEEAKKIFLEIRIDKIINLSMFFLNKNSNLCI